MRRLISAAAPRPAPGLTSALALALALGLGNAPAVQAATVEEGRAAYQRGDYFTARRALTEHAAAGNVEAQYLLGRMYANGEGVLQDFVPAHKWLNLAASQGNGEARALRDTISSRMTANQLAEAQRMARAWQPTPLPASASAQSSPPPAASASSSAPATSTAAAAGYQAPTSQRALVRDVQSMLAELGYDPGPADGLMGSRTRSAIRAYQLHSGIGVTGEPSASLHRALATDLGYVDRGTGSASGTAQSSAATSPAASQAATSSEPVYVQEARQNTSPPPPASTAPAVSPGALSEAEPVARLRAIIDAAEARGSSSPRFMASLRDLVNRHDQPWKQVVVEDAFRDGDYTRGPRWEVTSGQFWVDRNDGLRTQVRIQAPPGAAQQAEADSNTNPSKKDIGLAILGAILAQNQQQGGGTSAGNAASDAEIRLPARIPASYALDARILSGEAGGRLELGVYTRGRSDVGYRVVYLGGGPRSLQLVRVNGTQQSVIELHDGSIELDDGRPHHLRWSRDAGGYMQVSIDGQPLIQVADRSFNDGFDGVTLTNRGGNYGLQAIRVLGQ